MLSVVGADGPRAPASLRAPPAQERLVAAKSLGPAILVLITALDRFGFARKEAEE